MIFKRRNPRTTLRIVAEFIWPRGGWRRAATYVLHRMRRLPDTPERICIGIAAGLYVSFLPIWGLHFISAATVAWICRGNILAALLGTFYGNPFTFPLIAGSALETGHWLLATDSRISMGATLHAIGVAGGEFWHNILTPFTGEAAHWARVAEVFHDVYLPFFVGGLVSGLPVAVATYYIHLPLIRAYQNMRKKRLKHRFEAARERQRAATTGEPT